jgi:hypothetical protein
MSDKIKDLILEIGLWLVGIIALIAIRASEGGTRIESAAKLTYATMPTIYAWLLILLVALLMFQTLLAMRSEPSKKRKNKDIVSGKSQETDMIISRKTIFLRTWGTLFILLCYVLALPYVHFILLTTIFLTMLFVLYGQRSIKKIAIVSVCGGLAYYFLFIYILNLPL